MTAGLSHADLSTLAAAWTAVDAIDSKVEDWLTVIGDDVPAALMLLANVRDLRQSFAVIEARVEQHCARTMPTRRVEFAGITAERRGGNTYRDWDTQRVLSRVVTTTLADHITGEVITDSALVWKVRDAIFDVFSLTPRVGVLRARGITWDDACTVTRGRRTVHVSRADEARGA